jgi:Asp-tRNA(Asn)/Glu-tRNA(Gln) amidotransferase A subunit family amidase
VCHGTTRRLWRFAEIRAGALDIHRDDEGHAAAPVEETLAVGCPHDEAAHMEVCSLSALDLAASLRRRELSATDALEAILERADQIEGPLNPFAVRLDDRARRAAAAADAALAAGDGGPLCGVPLTIKDSQWLAGVTSAVGSRALADFVPTETCAAVERLEAAGAVIFAKTTTPEFCYFGVTESPLNGRTSNPWNVARTPGGSSGGAGAAVAAGAGPLALGGDGGGSIRIPSAFCGLAGFKPTFGLVAREPCSPGWKSLVSYGPMARNVADARAMLLLIAGPEARDRNSLSVNGLDRAAPDPGELRIAVSEDLGFAPVDDDVRRAFRATVALLESAGATIIEDSPGLDSSVQTWSAIAVADARYAEPWLYEQDHELIGEDALTFMGYGGLVTAAEYVQAQVACDRIHRAYVDMFERNGASVLLTPALGCEAFEHGTGHPAEIGGVPIEPPWTDWAGFLYDANLAGLPACALPVGLGDDHLPVSVQLLGRRGDDGAVLAAAEAVERLVGFDTGPPTQLATFTDSPLLARGDLS